jgi:hypothetical protein
MTNQFNSFPFLKLPNLFPTMEDLNSHQGVIIAPILLSFIYPQLHPNMFVLVLMDLKTNKILYVLQADDPFKLEDITTCFQHLMDNGVIIPADTTMHLLKQNPFTTKGFAHFLVLNKFNISFYNRANDLPNINVTEFSLLDS